MDLNLLKSKFSNEALIVIENEVREKVLSLFSSVDIANHLNMIESFFIQPIFYATLLNYYTMMQQNSSISLSAIASDENIDDSYKDALANAFATELGLDLSNNSPKDKLIIIDNQLSMPDPRIKTLQALIQNYDAAYMVASGASREMYRNVPDFKYFAKEMFAIPFIYENMKSFIPTDINNQPISIEDINRYKQLDNSGRSGNSADVYLFPYLTSETKTINVGEGETGSISFDSRKYVSFSFDASSGLENLSFSFSDGNYLGFHDRSVVISSSGACNVHVTAYYINDNKDIESNIMNQLYDLDIVFTGMVPIYVDVTLQNSKGLDNFKNKLGTSMITKDWLLYFAEESSKMFLSNNQVLSIEGEMLVNPMMSMPVKFAHNQLVIPSKSIMSWVSHSNSFIMPRNITIAESGNVESF